MHFDRRRFLMAGAIGLSALAGCTGQEADDTATSSPTDPAADTPTGTPSGTPMGTATVAATPKNGAVTIEGSEWTLSPAVIRAPNGQQLEITFKNVGSVAHNFTLGQFPVEEKPAAKQAEAEEFAVKTETIQGGETATATHTPTKTGTFPYWCDVSGHREAGMEGKLIVEE